MSNIYLVGFMGTGKTTVGRELARRLKRCFADLDDLIELKEGRVIRDIFAQSGEPYFRRIEKEVLKEVARENNFVVACGGGAVLDKENIAAMKNSGAMICLSASADVIFKRTYGHGHRPILNVANPQERIILMLKMRSPFYTQADKVIDTSKLSIKETAARILKIIELASIKNAIPRPKTKKRKPK